MTRHGTNRNYVTFGDLAVYRGARRAVNGRVPPDELRRTHIELAFDHYCNDCGQRVSADGAYPTRQGVTLCRTCIENVGGGYWNALTVNEDLFNGRFPVLEPDLRCKRPECEHRFSEHAPVDHGGCWAGGDSPNGSCRCPEFDYGQCSLFGDA